MTQVMYEELLRQFSSAIEALPTKELKPVKALALYLSLIRTHLLGLKELMLEKGFSSLEEEIWFFKELKPKFLSEQIYRFELYTLEMKRPVGTVDMVRSYLEDELRIVQRFFQQYAFLYQYYRTEAVEMDHTYFLRNVEIPDTWVVDIPDLDAGFSTGMDHLFAKFMAYERLQIYLLEAIQHPFPMVHEEPGKQRRSRELRWTGDAINVVELGFSLYDTGQLNEGKASITEIFEWLEEQLHVSVGKPHKRLEEIDARKRISKTHFLDMAKMAFLNRLDRKNAFDPEKEASRRQRADKRQRDWEKKTRAAEEGTGL
ncbi:RteC domain-containing protein [Pedobacter sp. GR22-6]|uniref:RteC domain-containing protein n=1 Tax=Pedobacter sp. GR22-6 TaxID=3127957 RepID=UPI00307F1EE9